MVDTYTETVDPEGLELALKRANARLANQDCRNWGCRIELDGQVVTYTLMRDHSPLPGPVRFCRLDAMALAKERNASLSFETAWRVDLAMQAAPMRSRTAHNGHK